MTTCADRLVVRPRPWKLALYLLGAVVFVVAGVWLMSSGDAGAFVAGALSVAFFGGLLVLVIVNARTRRLTLTPEGIDIGGTIPWADVESVGVVKHPTTMVALRLYSYDRYLASQTADGTREAKRTIRFLKPFAHFFRMIPSMRRYAAVQGQADELRWNRETYGFDIGISPAWLDRSPGSFVDLVERCRRQCG
ncbi:STM3941 family protein [Lentzea atacamensis]|uniref:STM3941 family protein n=1 Tax=Lentzea atacamensis TaxID=531938 RepID=UPI0011B7E755|nr:STM3941 family protein [Lentzea atacamensis]